MKRWFLSWVRAWKAYRQIQRLLASPVYDAVKYAVDKTGMDVSFRPKFDHEMKRADAEVWTRLYAKEYGIPASSQWAINLLIEYHLGVKKGLL